MADEEEEIVAEKSQQTHLFPIVSDDNDKVYGQQKAVPLFPSATVVSSQSTESLDWLSNKSYKNIDIVNLSEDETSSKQASKVGEQDSDLNDSLDEASHKKMKLEKHDKKHHKKHKLKNHKKHKHKKQKHNEKIKSKDEEKLTKLPSTIWIEESGLELEKAFRIYKKPDYDNISFGGLYRLDIALHKLNPKLKCLGLRPGEVIAVEHKKKKVSEPERYWQNQRSFSSDVVLVPCKATRTPSGGSSGFSKNFSYVPLELPYLAGEKECTDDGQVSTSNDLISKTKFLNTKVREEPNNIEAWLALADLQSKQVQHGEVSTTDSLSQVGLEKHKRLSKLELEKKSAVLEQALEKNPTSVDLIVTHMKVCQETLTGDKIAEKWNNLLFIQPQKTILWKHYLMFCQANFSSFSFSSTLAVYSKCFTTLAAIKDGSFRSHSPEPDTEVGMVEIFIQYSQFLRQAGHMEKAVAAFQALVEFNCFFPESIVEEMTTASAVSLFESFWDSDLPRFGEDNASGWQNYLEKKPTNHLIPVSDIFSMDTNQETTMTDLQDEIIKTGFQKPQTWVNLEALRKVEHWQPKVTANESEEDDEMDDPDRVVLFQDISSSLFRISQENLKFQLVYYFLAFLGVAVEDLGNISSVTVSLDSVLQVILEDEKQLRHFDSDNGWRFSCWWPQYEIPVNNTVTTNTTTTPSRRMFIRNIFNQSLESFSEEYHQSMVPCLWLSFERDVLLAESNSKQRKQCYKSVRKLAKSLLKMGQFCNDLKLWMAFVRIECTVGNMVEARRIVNSTLQQTAAAEDVSLNERSYSFLRSYCEMEMALHDSTIQGENRSEQPGNEDTKNRILSAIAFVSRGVNSLGSTLTPSQTLKTHKTLQETNIRLSSQQQQRWTRVKSWEERAQTLLDFTISYTLFNYWSLGLEAARSVLDSFLSLIGEDTPNGLRLSGSKYHVEILVFYTRLLQYHSKYSICPVKPLRQLLVSSLGVFPENPYFLDTYATLELRSCVATSVRRFFDRVVPSSRTPVPWLFAIFYEKRRRGAILPETGKTSLSAEEKGFSTSVFPVSGVVNRLRSLYEKAIAHPSARNCVALWRSYMHFEAENGDLRQAKAIFYQSLQCCAWAKVLYCDAVKLFPELLQDLHDMMEEKELRIRFPLDELDLLVDTSGTQ